MSYVLKWCLRCVRLQPLSRVPGGSSVNRSHVTSRSRIQPAHSAHVAVYPERRTAHTSASLRFCATGLAIVMCVFTYGHVHSIPPETRPTAISSRHQCTGNSTHGLTSTEELPTVRMPVQTTAIHIHCRCLGNHTAQPGGAGTLLHCRTCTNLQCSQPTPHTTEKQLWPCTHTAIQAPTLCTPRSLPAA